MIVSAGERLVILLLMLMPNCALRSTLNTYFFAECLLSSQQDSVKTRLFLILCVTYFWTRRLSSVFLVSQLVSLVAFDDDDASLA